VTAERRDRPGAEPPRDARRGAPNQWDRRRSDSRRRDSEAVDPERADQRRRLFIAVPLADEARARIVDLVGRVKAATPDADALRWVRHESLHLTLRFLGATPEDVLPALTAAIDRIASGAHAFDVAIDGAGAFPSPSRPRVLWLGITEGAEELAGLADALEAPLDAEGWPPDDRPFRPHLTLARADGVRSGPATAKRLIEAAEALDVRFRAQRVVLYESRTERGGARYLPVHERSLGPET
jgi:RNA 2',3'-cyclic 3'-phosphodiesterase